MIRRKHLDSKQSPAADHATRSRRAIRSVFDDGESNVNQKVVSSILSYDSDNPARGPRSRSDRSGLCQMWLALPSFPLNQSSLLRLWSLPFSVPQ